LRQSHHSWEVFDLVENDRKASHQRNGAGSVRNRCLTTFFACIFASYFGGDTVGTSADSLGVDSRCSMLVCKHGDKTITTYRSVKGEVINVNMIAITTNIENVLVSRIPADNPTLSTISSTKL
jgi:hypothetical protein